MPPLVMHVYRSQHLFYVIVPGWSVFMNYNVDRL